MDICVRGYAIYVCACMCLYMCGTWNIYLSICLSVCLSVCLSITLPVALSVDLQVFWRLHVCLFKHSNPWYHTKWDSITLFLNAFSVQKLRSIGTTYISIWPECIGGGIWLCCLEFFESLDLQHLWRRCDISLTGLINKYMVATRCFFLNLSKMRYAHWNSCAHETPRTELFCWRQDEGRIFILIQSRIEFG